MEIETELPDNFETLGNSEKIDHLEDLKEEINSDSDTGALKKRFVEELIRKYSEDSPHESDEG